MTMAATFRSIARDWRGPTRRLTLGLGTLLGVGRRGYFVPYRHAARLIGQRVSYNATLPIFERERPGFARVLRALDDLGDSLREIERTAHSEVAQPRWAQDWFPPLDAAIAYTLVRTCRPRRIVEIGSGHSTRFLLRAMRDSGMPARLMAIDPEPRATLPSKDLEIRRATIQDVGLTPFACLEPGDFVVVDSSHILMPGSDVDIIVNAVLPLLPQGTYVHFHDIFLPDDYPADWHWRSYNEQSVVAALLLSGAYRPIFSSYYAATRMADAVAKSTVATLPRLAGARDSSLWLVKGAVGTAPP